MFSLIRAVARAHPQGGHGSLNFFVIFINIFAGILRFLLVPAKRVLLFCLVFTLFWGLQPIFFFDSNEFPFTKRLKIWPWFQVNDGAIEQNLKFKFIMERRLALLDFSYNFLTSSPARLAATLDCQKHKMFWLSGTKEKSTVHLLWSVFIHFHQFQSMTAKT